ncbi:hypothetical protein BGZ73_001914 [Actinomortierella ambigua]|nr:hypothetical protein BGZ73_001914 [Actinomortierella ambigua]
MHLSKSLLVLAASATLAYAQNVILSKGILLGEDTTDPKAHGARIYSDPRNHPTAAASMLYFSAEWFGYMPSSNPPPKSTAVFDKYESKVKAFPGFKKIDEYIEFVALNGGLDDFEDKILNGYHGYGRRAIASSLRNLIPKTNKDPTLNTWILTLPIIISRPRMDVTVKLVRIAVHLQTDDNGKVELPGGQFAQLAITELRILPDVMKTLAENLAGKLKQTSIDKFKAYFTTKWDENNRGDRKKKLGRYSESLEFEQWQQALSYEEPPSLW